MLMVRRDEILLCLRAIAAGCRLHGKVDPDLVRPKSFRTERWRNAITRMMTLGLIAGVDDDGRTVGLTAAGWSAESVGDVPVRASLPFGPAVVCPKTGLPKGVLT